MADELVEQIHLLAGLEEHPGWHVLTEVAKERSDRALDHLIRGQAKTIEEYRHHAGLVEGIRFVIGARGILEARREREALNHHSNSRS